MSASSFCMLIWGLQTRGVVTVERNEGVVNGWMEVDESRSVGGGTACVLAAGVSCGTPVNFEKFRLTHRNCIITRSSGPHRMANVPRCRLSQACVDSLRAQGSTNPTPVESRLRATQVRASASLTDPYPFPTPPDFPEAQNSSKNDVDMIRTCAPEGS